MNVPDKIRIGGFDYDVKMKKRVDGSGNIGVIEYESRRVLLKKKLAESSHFETLWHECVHGLMEQAGLHVHDEPLVNQIASGICQILRDNPYLRGEQLFDPLLQGIRETNSGLLPETFQEVGTFTQEDNGK